LLSASHNATAAGVWKGYGYPRDVGQPAPKARDDATEPPS